MYYYAADGQRYVYSHLGECLGKAVEHAVTQRAALLDKSTTVAVTVYSAKGPTLASSAVRYVVEASPTLRITVTNH